MPGESYSYHVVIGVDVDSQGARAGTRDLEAEMTRWEKRAIKSIERIQKAMDNLAKTGFDPTKTAKSNAQIIAQQEKITRAILASETAQITSNERLAREKAKTYKFVETANERLKTVQIRNAQLVEREERNSANNRVKFAQDSALRMERIKQAELRTSIINAKEQDRLSKKSSLGALPLGLGTAAVGGLGLALGMMVKIGVEYERSMNMFQAVTRASATEMRQASKTAVDLGNYLKLPGISAKDAAEAMTELGKGGLTAAQAMEAARGTIQLSIAANIDAAKAAEINANALNAFQLKAGEAGRVADLLAASSAAASGEMTDMAEALTNGASVFASAGLKIEELVTSISLLAKNGIIGAEAGTNLKQMLLQLEAPSNEAKELMKQLGINIYDASGNMKSMRDIIANLIESTKALTLEKKNEYLATIFGARAVNSANILIKEGVASYDAMTAAVTRTGAAADLAAARSKGLGGAWESLKSQVETLGLEIYDAIAKPLTVIVTFIATTVIPGFGKLIPILVSLTVAAVGLKIAWMLLNAQFKFDLIAKLVFALGGLYEALLAVAAGSATAAQGMAVATAGLSLLAAAIGLLIYAYMSAESAIDKANDVTIESIQQNQQAVTSYKQMAIEIQDVAASQSGSAEQHEKLNAVIDKLDPTTQAYIKTLLKEKDQISEVSDAIDGNIQRNEEILKSKLNVAAAAVQAAQKEIDASNETIAANVKRIQSGQDRINFIKEEMATVDSSTGVYKNMEERIDQVRKMGVGYSQQNIETEKTLNDLNLKFAENEAKVVQSAKALGYNSDQLREFLSKAGYTQDQIDRLVTAFEKLTVKQDNAAVSTDNVTGAVEEQTKAVFNLRKELAALTAVNQEKVDKVTLDIVKNSATKADAIAKAKQAKIDLKDDLKIIKDVDDKTKAVQDILSPTVKSSGGGGGGRTRRSTKEDRQRERQELKDESDKQLRDFNKALRDMDSTTKMLIQRFAQDQQIPLQLAYAQLYSESGFANNLIGKDKNGKMPKLSERAYGVGQIQVGTANRARQKRGLGAVNAETLRTNIEVNLQTWSLVMSDLFDKYGDWDLAILAYHQGEGTVDKALQGKGKGIGPQGKAYSAKITKLAGITGNARFTPVKSDEEIEGERQIESILKLRKKLNYQTDQPIPQTSKEREETLRQLNEYDGNMSKIADKTREVNEILTSMGSEKMISIAQILDPEEAKRTAKGLDLLSKTLTDLQSTEEDQKMTQAELAAEYDDGLNSLQKFDLQMKELQESGKFTAEVWDTLVAPAVAKTRAEIERTVKMEFAKKLREQTKAVTEAVGAMADGFKTELAELNSNDSPLTGFFKQLESIKELKFEAGGLDKIKEMFTVGNQVDVEKFAEYVRWWLNLRAVFGDFDATKVDEVVEKLKTAAKGFNEVTTKKQSSAFEEAQKDLLEELSGLQNVNKELTRYDEVLKELDGDYKNLDPLQKQRLLDIAKEIDAQNQLNEAYDKFHGFITDSLETLATDGFGGLFKSIVGQFKSMLIKMAADWISSAFFKLVFGKTPGQSGSTGNGGGLPTGGGGLLDLLFNRRGVTNSGGSSNLGGGGTGGVGGTPNFNPNLVSQMTTSNRSSNTAQMLMASNGGANLNALQDIPTLTNNAHPNNLGSAMHAASLGISNLNLGGGGGHGNASGPAGTPKFDIKNIFGKGGIFGEQGFGFNSGTISGLGAIGGMAGSMIGGPVGSILMGAASGIGLMSSLSSMLGISAIGGPVGLAIGAAVGGIIALGSVLFGRNKLRRQEEKVRNQAMLDAFSAMDKLVDDVNADRIDGNQALSQADDIRKNYIEQMSQLKDKKTRRIALADVSRIDAKIATLKSAVKNQSNRQANLAMLSPTFADGGSTSGFIAANYRNNPLGYVTGPGSATSDAINAWFPAAGRTARISHSEYVLDAETTRNIGVSRLDRIRGNRGRNLSRALDLSSMAPGQGDSYADGGSLANNSLVGSSGTATGGGNGSGMKVFVTNNIFETEDGKFTSTTDVWIDTPDGKQKIEDVVEELIYRNGIQGKIPKAMLRVEKGQG